MKIDQTGCDEQLEAIKGYRRSKEMIVDQLVGLQSLLDAITFDGGICILTSN